MNILYNIDRRVLLVLVSLMWNTTLMANQSSTSQEDEHRVVEMVKDSREDYTIGSSVVTITGEELLNGTYHPNLASALVGKVPGLIMLQTEAEPGNEGFSSNIRGYGRGPLFIVDGVVLSGLNSVNINDVESVTIMKDAVGGAMYGLQSSGGVIMVTTKRGGGESKITASVNYSMQEALTPPARLGSKDHVTLTTEAWENDGLPEKNPYTPAQIEGYQKGENLEMFPDTDWYNMFSKKQVSTLNAHIGASGGGEYIKYYTSIGYMNQTSPFVAPEALEAYGTHRISIRSNIEAKLNSFITGFVHIGSRINRHTYTGASGGNSGVVSSIFDLAPTTHGPLTPEGNVIVTPNNLNPTYGRLNRSGYVQSINTQTLVNVGLKFDLSAITKGLTTTGSFKYEMSNTANHIGQEDYVRYARDLSNLDELIFYKYGSSEDQPLTFDKGSSISLSRELDWDITYDRVFGDHLVSAAGFVKYTYQNYRDVSQLLPRNRMGYGGRATYGYKSFIFADYTFSYQGSEQFIPENRYSLQHAGSLAVVLSNCDFLRDNSTISYLKLKGSYGIVGSDNFSGSRFLYDDILTKDGSNIVSGLGSAITINKLGNPNITWEKFVMANAGVEIELWDQLNIGVEYFQNSGYDLLTNDNITPSISGVPRDAMPQINLGEQINRGVDVTLGYSRSFSNGLQVGFNSHFMYYKKETVEGGELPNVGYAYEYRSKGFRTGQNWGYVIDYSNGNGYFNTEDELANSGLTYTGSQPRLGDFIYVDQNDDDKIDDKDLVPMGESRTPQINWGAELLLQYRGFDFTALLQGVAKYGGFNSGIGYYENTNGGVFFAQHLGAWTKERYQSGEEITAPALTMTGSSSQKPNNYYYEDKAFWRVKNLGVGYTVPTRLTEKILMDKLRIYANVINPFTVDNLKNENHDVEGAQIDGFLTQRYWNFGLNITF